jgi:integrase
MKLILQQQNSNQTCDFTTIEEPFGVRFYEYIKEQKDTRKKKESSLVLEFTYFKEHSAPFMASRGMKSLSEIDTHFIREFTSYLATKHTAKGELLAKSTARNIFGYLKAYTIWLASYYPKEAPNVSLFEPNPFSKGANDTLKTKPLEDDVLEQFKKAIRKEENIYHKACFSVALYQGLRSEDIMQLEADCLREDADNKGKYDLYYYNAKADEWMQKRTFSAVVKALKMLIDETKELRKESGEKRLFIHKIDVPQHGIVGNIERYGFMAPNQWLKSFIKRHNIINENGTLAKVHMHQFRSTLLTNMDSEGIDIEIGAHQADHKHSSTTQRYYIHSTDKTYNEQMDILDKVVDSIGIADDVSVIDDVEFQANADALRLDDGYCRDTKMATDDEYVCEYYKSRGNCYGCSKMITTPDFLPYFYDLLKEKEQELKDKSKYGEHVLRQIRFELSLIKVLIEKLEAITKDVA